MGRFRITEDAKEDLRRIYRYGVLTFGEAQADRYYDNLFERFSHKSLMSPIYINQLI